MTGREGSRSVRYRITGWFAAHEIAWELLMAALAVVYVAIDPLRDAGFPDEHAVPVDGAITLFFLAEFGVRAWAAPSRRGYVYGHIPDLVALVPTTRPLRIVRLLRLVRLLRSMPVLYHASGLDLPIVRRLAWHMRRVEDAVDPRILTTLILILFTVVGTVAMIVTLSEKDLTIESFGESLYWAANTVLGSGDPGYVTTPLGWLLNWLLIVLGLTLLAVATGLLVGLIVDIALKEGRGMGAAGYHDHVVVCGWNASARALIGELEGDEYGTKIALVTDLDENPARGAVHFVNGDPASVDDLERAGIREARAALVFPADTTDATDMRSILVVLAVKSMAPRVRVIAEVNNASHVDHFRRAGADEVVVPSQLAAHLAARSALYPGLTDLVSDIVAGGEGSELYRVELPEAYVGLTVAEVAQRLLGDHSATLMAIGRGKASLVNPRPGEIIQAGDDALVLAESIGSLKPLNIDRALAAS